MLSGSSASNSSDFSSVESFVSDDFDIEVDVEELAKARKDKIIQEQAEEQAKKIGLYFLKNIEAKDWELDDEEKQKILIQRSIMLSLDSCDISVQITATGTSFNFPSEVLATNNIDDFCELLQEYIKSCGEANAENLEFTLEGSDPDMLKEVAKGLYEKQGIKLNKIVVTGQGGGVIEGYDAIGQYLYPQAQNRM